MEENKEANKTTKSKEVSLTKAKESGITQYLPTVPDMNYINNLAETLSGALAKPFILKDDDNKVIMENGKPKIDTGAVVANMVLGHEMGIPPMASLQLGDRINADAYMSVIRGRELGIDAVSSIDKIYHINNKISLAKDIIIAQLLKVGAKVNYIRKYEPTPIYKGLDGKYVGHRHMLCDKEGVLKNIYHIYVKTNLAPLKPNASQADKQAFAQKQIEISKKTKAEIVPAIKDGKIVLYQSGITYVSSVHIIRESNSIDEVWHYSIQEAIDASLHEGFHSRKLSEDGKSQLYVTGKPNWNNHPAQHLTDRVLKIAATTVVADKIMGNYSHEEMIEILDTPNINTVGDLSKKAHKVQDAVEVEETNE